MQHVDIILARFLNLYGKPKCADYTSFAGEYRTALGPCDPDRMRKAIDRIIGKHAFQTWPTVGECLNQYRELTADVHREAELRATEKLPPPKAMPSQESRDRIDGMIAALKAKMAAINDALPRAEVRPPNRDEWTERQIWLHSQGRWASGYGVSGSAP
jgi:hypothetical protein